MNWGPKLFVTTASDEGAVRTLLCLDKDNGKLIWRRDVTSDRKESQHKMNSWATASAATDGECVVAFYGPAGIHCYDLEGEKLWSRDLGQFPGDWGVAASPIIIGQQVIQNCDAIGPSKLISLDKKTGKILLSGAPRVEQGDDIIKGYQITLRENVEMVEVDDSQSSFSLKRNEE